MSCVSYNINTSQQYQRRIRMERKRMDLERDANGKFHVLLTQFVCQKIVSRIQKRFQLFIIILECRVPPMEAVITPMKM